MDRPHNIETSKEVTKKQLAQERITKLNEMHMFPEGFIDQNNGIIANLCDENRWFIRDENENLPTELSTAEINSTDLSSKRIDNMIALMDESLDFQHAWTVLVTYVDLIKKINSNTEVRIRYEIVENTLNVKWFVIDKTNGSEFVYVLIAENDDQIMFWEDYFIDIPAENSKVVVKHQKYFLLDSDGNGISDYEINELDGKRLEINLLEGPRDLAIYHPNDFLGVFVQDRFKLPLSEHNQDGVLGFEEIIDLVHNELLSQDDKISVFSKFGLVNEGIRLELETYTDEDQEDADENKLNILKSRIEHAIESNGLSELVTREHQ